MAKKGRRAGHTCKEEECRVVGALVEEIGLGEEVLEENANGSIQAWQSWMSRTSRK